MQLTVEYKWKNIKSRERDKLKIFIANDLAEKFNVNYKPVSINNISNLLEQGTKRNRTKGVYM